MSTVGKTLALKIIEQNGYFEDDPRVHQVVKYTNAWGSESYAILYPRDVSADRYAPSAYVINPEVIWSAT